MENKTYVGVFEKIGPIEISIKGRYAHVASVLGVKEYNYKLLPNTQNNGYAILKYALKNYFSDFLAENKPAKKYEKKNMSTLNMFLNYFMPQTSMLETNDVKSVVYGEMEKNMKHYSWEDVDKFRCVQGGSVMESLKRPLVIGFNGFEEDFFVNENVLKINKKAVEKLRKEQKRVETDVDETKLAQTFVNKEIEYLERLFDYEREFAKCDRDIFCGDLKLFFDVLSSQENLVEKMLEQFMGSMDTLIDEGRLRSVGNKSRVIGEFLKHRKNGMFENKFNKDETGKNKDETGKNKDETGVISTRLRRLNVVNICEFVIDNVVFYLPYINFMNNYEKLIDKYQNVMVLRACFSEIIQKITNFPVFFKCMLKYVRDEIVEITYLKTDKYSKMLHSVANETYLNEELLRLFRDSVNLGDEWDVTKMRRLYAKATCSLVNGRKIFLYVFEEYLGIFDENHLCLHMVGLDTLDFYIFDMRIFLFFSASSFKTEIFKKLEYSRLHYLVLCTANKESIHEFKEVFYARKYNCKVYSNSRWGKDLILYKRDNFNDEDVVFSKLSDDSDLKDNCKSDIGKDPIHIKESMCNNTQKHNKDSTSNEDIENITTSKNTVPMKDQFNRSITNISITKRSVTNRSSIKINSIRFNNSWIFEYVEAFIEESQNNKKYILELALKKAHRKINNEKDMNINQKQNTWIDRLYKVRLTVSNFDISTLDVNQNNRTDISTLDLNQNNRTDNSTLDLNHNNRTDNSTLDLNQNNRTDNSTLDLNQNNNRVIELTESQMIDISKNIQTKKILEKRENKTYLEKIKVLLSHIAESRLKNFELYAYNEDIVIQEDKVKIFEVFTRLIDLKIKKSLNKPTILHSNEKIDSFYHSILYPDDVLRKYASPGIVSYLKEYLLILHSYKQAESILSNGSLEHVITLFCMFMQRNLYAFLKPCEVSSLEAAFDTQSHDSIIAIMRQNKFLEKIAHFVLPLYYRDSMLSTMVIYTFYRKKIDDTVFYQILKTIALNI